MKKCTKCGYVGDTTHFYRNKRRKDGYSSWCKTCDREYQIKVRDRTRHQQRYRDYGITKEQSVELLRQQDSKCAICLEHITLANCDVDHSHTTGKVRGLLCPKCNRGIGLLGDSTDNLIRAIKYLE